MSSQSASTSLYKTSLALGEKRGLRLKLPSGEAVVIAYSVLLAVGGVLLVLFPYGLDSMWPLLMVPILIAALHYHRRLFLMMLTSYVTISLCVMAASSENILKSLVVMSFFMLAVGIASEVLYRLSAAREHARQALRESELRFRSLSATAPIGIFQTDADGMCTYANARCEAIMGLSRGESLNAGWLSVIHPEDRATMLDNWAAAPLESPESSHELRILTPQGELRWVNAISTALLSTAGNIMSRVGTLEDITERKRTAEALRRVRGELEARIEERTAELKSAINSQTALLNQLTTVQEAERRRLSMDIHDGPLQSLGVSLMALDRAIRRRERGEHELVAQELRYLRDTLTTTVSEVRAVLADLSLELLGNYGLEAALRSQIERFSNVTGTMVNLRYCVAERLSPEIELLMYRLAQESLANVRKHAYAECVEISVKLLGNDLHMTIADDGRGFDVDAALRHHQDGEKLGLRSMLQRVQAVHGDLTISSAPGEGTTLQFWCPVTSQNPGKAHPIRQEITV